MKHTMMKALDYAGCPACQLVREREEKYFWWFFTENYHEANVLTDLMDNSYLCDHHADILAGGDPGSLSYVFQFLVQGEISRFKQLGGILDTPDQENLNSLSGYFQRNKGRTKQWKIIDDHLKGYLSCRFCRVNDEASRYVAGVLAGLIREEPGFRDLYQKSHGLCRRHFVEVLKLCGDKDSADFLLNDMVSRLQETKHHFDLYYHKLDHRFADEPKVEEQNTWLSALRYYSSYKDDGPDRK